MKFSRKGFGGGPGYDGALPRGLAFTDTRSAVRERLGPPARVNPNVAVAVKQQGARSLVLSD